MRNALRALVGALLLGAALLRAPDALAIRPADEARRDAKRFGLAQFRPKERRKPSPAVLSAFDEFNKKHQAKWQMRFNPRTGAPEALVEGKTAPRAGRPAEVAAAFLSESRAMLQIQPEALAVLKETSGSGHHHVLYRQTYRGVPVEFSRVKVHLDDQGSVTGVHSSFEPDLDLEVTPGLSAASAADSVLRDLGSRPTGAGTLVVFPNERTGRAHLAWKFTARQVKALWRYYVDARTGEVLFRYNDLRFQTAGTVQGMVFDLDPVRDGRPSQAPGARPFRHERVYVQDGANSALTAADGTYTHPSVQGKIFTQLAGPFVSAASYRGASAHYDNGSGLWAVVGPPVSSPHPYPDNSVLVSTIDLSGLGIQIVKFLPVFSSFDVGAVTSGGVGEGADVTDDDEVTVTDAAGTPFASYAGNKGAFNGAAVPGTVMRLSLRSNASGHGTGYEVNLSSYLILSAPTVPAAGGNNVTWLATHTYTDGRRSELSLFYHLNLAHDYFMADVNKSSAAFIDKPVVAMALAGPGIINAFYNPDNDNFLFGDGDTTPGATNPQDIFADDATVPRHEYTHYVVEKIWSIQNFGQAGAISEANADYWSATQLDATAIGLYANEQLGNAGPLRELDDGGIGNCQTNPVSAACKKLGDGANGTTTWFGEIHLDSVFISQALWDVRTALIALLPTPVVPNRANRLGATIKEGQSCSDGLVFQSLLFFPESFAEFRDAMRKVADMAGAPGTPVPNCNGTTPAQLKAQIDAAFSAHGLGPAGGTNDPFDTTASRNDGFQTAVDVSTYAALSATIHPAADIDFYRLAAGPGPLRIKMTLPPAGFYFKGYTLALFDRDHRLVAELQPPFDGTSTDLGFCLQDDCTTSQQALTLNYDNPAANQFFLEVAGGPTLNGGSNSQVNSTLPYALEFSYVKPGAVAANVVAASIDNFDKDKINFTVAVSSFPVLTIPGQVLGGRQDYYFAYARLRDQALNVLQETSAPMQAPDFKTYLTTVTASVSDARGRVTGELQLAPGFAARFPSVGTVYLEVFGYAYSVAGSTVSLGISNPINLTTDRGGGGDLKAWNNVFNPNSGAKTTLRYDVAQPDHLTIRLYTLTGGFIATLFDDDVPAGKGSVDWTGRNFNGTTVASGIYLVHMKLKSGFTKTQKVAVVK